MNDQAGNELLVEGFGFGGFRSFLELQRIGPMGPVTVLAGRNNSGKSNVLRFVRDHLSGTVLALSSSPALAFAWADGSDAPLREGGEVASFSVCRDLRSDGTLRWVSSLKRTPGIGAKESVLGAERGSRLLEVIGDSTPGPPWTVWSTWHRTQRDSNPQSDELTKALSAAVALPDVQEFLPYLGGSPQAAHQHLLQGLAPSLPNIPAEPIFVPAFRQIRASAEDHLWDGAGLIQLLADLRDPDLGSERDAKHLRWRQFEQFVRDVLEDPNVDVRVPQNAARLIVTMNSRELDVQDLGTGIHEVIIIAAAATARERSLFLLEEPEIHIHPLLQRRLLDYITRSTTNQYLIATHSAHFLDFSQAAVFQLRLEDGWSVVRSTATNSQVVAAARDLGYRPSDLLQANSVIWVEGPSDRIYLRHWITALDSTLVEGVDYAIMFYGGRLASHLSGTDSDFGLGVDDLIELRRLNRISAIVIDSDRKVPGQQIRPGSTKGRLRDEFKADGVAWITQGREIENYVPPGLMLEAIQSMDPKAARLVSDGNCETRWRYRRAGSSKIYEANKVELARAVTDRSPDLDTLDLRKRVGSIVALIRSARDT